VHQPRPVRSQSQLVPNCVGDLFKGPQIRRKEPEGAIQKGSCVIGDRGSAARLRISTAAISKSTVRFAIRANYRQLLTQYTTQITRRIKVTQYIFMQTISQFLIGESQRWKYKFKTNPKKKKKIPTI